MQLIFIKSTRIPDLKSNLFLNKSSGQLDIPHKASNDSSCLQDKLDSFCKQLVKASCENFEFARFNTEKSRWRCYDSIAASSSIKSCVDETGTRIFCDSYTDDSLFCNTDSLSAIVDEGCVTETTEAATTEAATTEAATTECVTESCTMVTDAVQISNEISGIITLMSSV